MSLCHRIDGAQAVESLEALDEAVGLAHHHDAISGTAKQAVANDYSRRLASATARLQSSVSRTLSAIIFGGRSLASHTEPHDVALRTSMPLDMAADVSRTEVAEQDMGVSVRDNGSGDTIGERLPMLHHCTAANVSICPVILEESRSCEVILVVLHNPVAWTRTAWHQARQQIVLLLGRISL